MLAPRATGRERWKRGIVLVLALAALLHGWRVFWFLTDDAHIQFRYVSNSLLGYGYVWNPPPFLPVEGYTSFLWVLVLDGVWRVAGISPPQAANGISLLFSTLSVLLSAWMVLRMPLRPGLESGRAVFLALVLAGIVGNRTFLAWTSSGLETAMFNFWILLWIHAATRLSATRSSLHLLLLCCAVALIALSRPDGYLYAASTLVIAGASIAGRLRAGGMEPRRLLALLPLGLIPAHVLWRRSFYGEWLPNTYYAKYTGAWPEAGLRYALSFTLEYAVWAWAALLLAVGWRLLPRLASARAPSALAVLTVAAHVAYYTFVIGGDHFEYRVYSHVVPMVFLSFLWLLNRSGLGRRAAVTALSAFVALSAPIPWIHWQRSLELAPETGRFTGAVPIAGLLPAPVRWYGELFDGTQEWLIGHAVGNRHLQHRVFWQYQLDRFPTREEGAGFGADGDRPVLPVSSAGIAGWSLPHVAIIDRKGLNDYVIARAPVSVGAKKHMAHERRPPSSYVVDFRPNVTRTDSPSHLEVTARQVELTDRDVIGRELEWRRRAREWQAASRRRSRPPARSLLIIDIDTPPGSATRAHPDALGEDLFVFENAELSSTDPSRLAGQVTTVAEILAGRGAATGAFVECRRWEPGTGLERGFQTWSADADAAVDWLAEHRGGPFFLYSHVDTDDGEPVESLLRAAGERTIVVVVSGRERSERRELDPRLALFERDLAAVLRFRVPASSFPSVWCTGAQRSFARTVDVAPTVLEALGIEIDDLDLEGRSLFHEMGCGVPPDERSYSLHPEHGLYAVRRRGIGLFLSTDDGETWLYDLEADPPRRIDDERPGLVERMERALRTRIEAP